MKQSFGRLWTGAFLLCVGCLPAVAQQNVQFLPEVDVYARLNSVMRVYVEAKNDEDGGDPAQAGIGPSVQLYLKPIATLKKMRAFDLDGAKLRFLVLEAGHRYVAEPDSPATNRMIAAATFNFPMRAGFSMSDRNRADLDWKSGTFTWRYRNRAEVERTFAVRSYHFIPYIAVEPYYESQYGKWSTTALYAGSILPVGKHVEFNPYYEHENNTGSHKNHPGNAIGLAAYLFFGKDTK